MYDLLGVEINILAIVLAVVVSMVLGMLWYGPLFGNQWMALVGKKKEDAQMRSTDLIFALLLALLMAIGLNSVLQFAQQVSDLSMVANVLLTPLMLSVCFLKPALANEVIWEGRSKNLIALNWAHQFCTMLVMSAVLAYFIY